MRPTRAREAGRWPVVVDRDFALPQSAVAGPGGLVRLTVRDETRLRVLELGDTVAEVAGFAVAGPASEYAVSPDLTFAVVSDAEAVRAVNADGSPRWERPHPAPIGRPGSQSVLVSADGRLVWATLAAQVTDDGLDHWLVLDAASGAVLAEVPVEAHGSGSRHLRHPDGVHVGLDIGEGQEGSVLLWGRFEDGRLHHWRGEDDLVPAGISPAGDAFLTIAHDQEEAALHAFPAGDTIWTAPGDLIPRPPHDDEDDLCWDFYAGFVDAATVLLSDVEYDPDEIAGHFLVDAGTGQAIGAVDYPIEVSGYPLPLGDGTWLTAGPDTVVRWRLTD